MYATNVCRRDGYVLLRTNALEDELHTRVPLLLKTKRTSILPPYMLGVSVSSLKFALGKISGSPLGSPSIFSWGAQASKLVAQINKSMSC